MARPLRIEYKGVFYHKTSCGNERRRICFAKLDYGRFKEKGRRYHCQFVLIQGLPPFFLLMIEAKNYGPNWDYNFLSSLTYDHRMAEMNSRIALAPRRIALINSDRKQFGIPQNAKLQGVIVTSP